MTNKEAIEYNKNLRMYMQITDKKSEHKFLKENYTALDMAIEALEKINKFQTTYNRVLSAKKVEEMIVDGVMTLDEAIKHAEEVTVKKDKEAEEAHANQVRKIELIKSLAELENCTIPDNDFAQHDYTRENECKKCADEHRQLAGWLRELKTLKEHTGHWIEECDGTSRCNECGSSIFTVQNWFNYCPNCGARMNDEVEE